MKKISFLIIIIFCGINIYAQNKTDKMLLMNGDTINCTILSFIPDIEDNQIVYGYVKCEKKQKVKKTIIAASEVYSISYASGKDTLIYAPNTIHGFNLLPDDMLMYIQGVKYARDNYKGNWVYLESAAIGIAGSGFQFLGILILPVNSAVIGIVKGDPAKKYTEADPRFENNNFYDGFCRQARKKRMIKSVISGVGSWAVGTTIFFTIKH